MKRILVATDGSPSGDVAVDQAIDLAGPARAVLTILSVRHAPLPILGDPFYQRALSAELRRADAIVAAAQAKAQEAGVEAEGEVLDGDPRDRIAELARSRDVDLIVVGCRGRTQVVGTVLGSVSRAVVHCADRPVLVAGERRRRKAAA
jgi:nucleotide-binding universal stress UspA family protein